MRRYLLRLGLFIAIVGSALGPASQRTADGQAAGFTVTVDRTTAVGRSALAVGVTHPRFTVDTPQTSPPPDATAIANGKMLLSAATRYQNQHIYGWGATNPEPSPGVFNWSSLDSRINMIRAMGATPVISLCCAPDWMTALGTNTSTYPNLPPTPAHFADFAELARKIALRYPDVQYFIVWNEMKGFWNRQQNQWDYVTYTELYNQVYSALKSVSASIRVGGPYLTIEGTGTNTGPWFTAPPLTRRNTQVLQYFLQRAKGVDFLGLDRALKDYHDPKIYQEYEKMALTPWFSDIVTQVRALTAKPIWYVEEHVAGLAGGTLPFQASANASMLLAQVRSGAAASLQWDPETQPASPIDDNLYTSTHMPGGGQPYPTYYSFRMVHDYFSSGTTLYSATSSTPDVEVMASAAKTVLVNKLASAISGTVNGAPVDLLPYEVRLLDSRERIVSYQTFTPVITGPVSGSSVPSSFVLTGGAEPGSTVQGFSDGQSIGSVTAANNGLWSLPASRLSLGSHSLTAIATSPTRTPSSSSPAVTVSVAPATVSQSLPVPAVRPVPLGGSAGSSGMTPRVARTTAPAGASAATLAVGSSVWTRQFGTAYDDRAFAAASDSSGTYVAGGTYGALPGLTSAGNSDLFVAKYDLNGNVVWMRQDGTVGDSGANALAVDGTGVYIGGGTDMAFNGQTGFGTWDGYIRKYDLNGNVLWTRMIGTSGDDTVNAVSLTSDALYVAGHTDAAFSGFTNTGYDDAFVQKYSLDGTLVWTRQFGSGKPDYASAITADSTGVYVAGSTAGRLPGTTAFGMYDGFLRKYSTDGAVVWTRTFGTGFNDQATGIAEDTSALYVSGYAQGALGGGVALGGEDAAVIKYDRNGNRLWTVQTGTGADDRAYGITAGSDGVYVTGSTRGNVNGQSSAGKTDVFVEKLDSSGAISWTQQLGGPGNDSAYAVAATDTGVQVVGETDNALPGQTALGGADAFIAEFLP